MAVARIFPMSLSQWGWNAFFDATWKSEERGRAVPARVISQQRKLWVLAGGFGECWGEAAGKLRLAAEEDGADWPAVGDWVAAEVAGGGAIIQGVLPRASRFVRKRAGKRVEEQVLAANVDTAFLVSALDADFHPRRIERYLVQCWESGAKPVVLLNKADTCANAQKKSQEVERLAAGTIVHVISASSGHGFDELQKYLTCRETLVLLGSSGVGKSSIVNRLMGRALQSVREVRECDSRGRHTTTARELFALPSGALVIDTPGLRELQLWEADQGIAYTFSDIESLAARCRFSNCRHEHEPGCAVEGALGEGSLDPARLENWRKMLREQAFLERKIDAGSQHEAKRHIKTMHRAVRRMYRERDKEGKP